jgi:protein TonB
MSAIALRPPVQPADRFALCLCLAVIVHVMVVLGVGFAPEPAPAPRLESLEVTLVTQRTEDPPERPDALAQVNLRGGGDTEEKLRPTAPLNAPLPATTPAVAAPPPPSPAARPRVEAEQTPRPATAPRRAEPVPPRPAPRPAEQAAELTVRRDTAEQREREAPRKPATPAPAEPAPDTAEAAPAPAPSKPALPTAAQLITRSFALASLDSELQQKLQTHAKRPRQKYISANTQEYRYAAYMEAWRAKVERIGNINYPDEARQRKLSGALLLDVALRPDGSVIEILVRRSSGHKVLDDAAVRIVELAAPFAPFPDDIAREVDVLHVTRTWKFLNSDEFTAQ